MNICIFPGTFNPIHEGHLKMAQYVLKKYKFDKIIFIPSYIPPHKNIDKNLANHRFQMVKLLLNDNPQFEISDIEYTSEQKSYTLITINKIREMYGIENRLNIIIGTDAFNKIETWFNFEKIKNIAHFIVFPRIGFPLKEKIGWDYELVEADYFNISSTEIRNGIKKNKKLERYIKEHGLYRI